MFSIIIPTFNNLKYLENCLNSIKKHSKIRNQVIIHINDGFDGTLDLIKKLKIDFTYSKKNLGLCTSINLAAKKALYDYILYSHDDMYFCPGWDEYLIKEIKNINHNSFYFSGTMIESNSGHIKLNCGTSIENFNEKKLLRDFNKSKYYDHQGSHFAPHVVHKDLWNRVGGFSEEFNPGICSDPDFNMKLWNEKVRIFKGISKFRVYHFSSITTRKKTGFKQNKGDITFLKKWGFTSKFFKKHFMKSKSKYRKPLEDPNQNFSFFFDLLICKIKLIYLLILNK
jgi:glycosyltransferase involved in cell wall biosynthesis